MGKIRAWWPSLDKNPVGVGRDLGLEKAIGISMSDVMAAADARPAPPLSATDRLQRNLARTVTESTARAETLRLEIAAREAELADVLRAEEAASVALEALADAAEAEWPQALPPGWDEYGSVSHITEEDLSAACGLALEAEMKIPFEEAPVEILEELLSTEQIPRERFDEEMKRREGRTRKKAPSKIFYSGLIFYSEDGPGKPFHFKLDKDADLSAYLEAKRVEFGAHAVVVAEDG